MPGVLMPVMRPWGGVAFGKLGQAALPREVLTGAGIAFTVQVADQVTIPPQPAILLDGLELPYLGTLFVVEVAQGDAVGEVLADQLPLRVVVVFGGKAVAVDLAGVAAHFAGGGIGIVGGLVGALNSGQAVIAVVAEAARAFRTGDGKQAVASVILVSGAAFTSLDSNQVAGCEPV